MKSAATLIESTFLETKKPLLQLLKRRLGCFHTAEDLLQETYLRVLEQDSLDGISNLPAYLSRVASNLATDHSRLAINAPHNRHELLEEELVCPKPAPDQAAEASQQLDRLSELIGELPPQCRRILLMHKVQHLSHAEIARRLDISPRTVETQIGKALRTLRDRISPR